jgi:hypothetical protein
MIIVGAVIRPISSATDPRSAEADPARRSDLGIKRPGNFAV